MNVLGAGRGPATLAAVVLSLDEMQFLLETLEIDEVPVVLDWMASYDNQADHDRAMEAARQQLTDRNLLDGDHIHPDLADRLRGLYRPHWVVALRLMVDGQMSRMCLSKGDDLVTVALRGPDSYVLDEAGEDLPGPVLSALGAVAPLDLVGTNGPTEQLVPIFDDCADPAATAARLAEVCNPARDSEVIASAMAHCESHAEIVGVIYADGSRDVADNHITVFNTRAGRFIATASIADDGTKWSSFSSGTDSRLRIALQDLINSLPEREEFPRNPALA